MACTVTTLPLTLAVTGEPAALKLAAREAATVEGMLPLP